jgi:protein-S-isoprenylcysteine O-methyltransferase Ste14
MIGLKTHLAVYLILALLLLVTAYVVFRRIVRRDYLHRGHLTWLSSFLQLLMFAGLMSFPCLFNPPEWPWFWRLEGPTGPQLRILGLAFIVLGFVIAFGTMVAFGFEVKGLIRIGPYRITRNPQILGGYLLVIGTTVQWPSWYALGWIVLYGFIGHWMIITEEEHLRAEFGEEYERYCEQTPRYLWPHKPGGGTGRPAASARDESAHHAGNGSPHRLVVALAAG